MSEVYFSLDIETDGPIPFRNSMLQIGMAAFTLEDGVIGTFKRKLQPFEGTSPDVDTIRWWTETPEKHSMWVALHNGGMPWDLVMKECDEWVRSFADRGKPVCCASPAGYDWVFLRCYLVAALGTETVFKHRCWDARSHAMGVLGREYLKCGKEGIPGSWRPKDQPHTHDALDDALEQAYQFREQMKASRGQRQCYLAWLSCWPLLRGVLKHVELTARYVKEDL